MDFRELGLPDDVSLLNPVDDNNHLFRKKRILISIRNIILTILVTTLAVNIILIYARKKQHQTKSMNVFTTSTVLTTSIPSSTMIIPTLLTTITEAELPSKRSFYYQMCNSVKISMNVVFS